MTGFSGSSDHSLVEQIVQILQRYVDSAIDEYIVSYALETCGEELFLDKSESLNQDSEVSTSRLR